MARASGRSTKMPYHWEHGLLSHPEPKRLGLPQDELGQLIDWRLDTHQRRNSKREPMQRMFEISLKVDYATEDKHETMKKAVQIAARHILATAALLAEAVKPQIAVTGDDFFSGTQKIELFEDVLSKGNAQMAAAEGVDAVQDEGISSELLDSLKPDVMGA